MDPTEPEEEIRALLRGSDPISSAHMTPDAAERLVREIASTTSPRKGGRRRWLVAGLSVAILGVAAPAAAVAYLAARTGEFGQPGFTENDTSEWIITSAPDFVDESRTMYPE